MTREDLEDMIGQARGWVAEVSAYPSPSSMARETASFFARALIRLAELPCVMHGGAVHGQEAEELRAGVEKILKDADGAKEMRRALIALLDRVDARDSLAFLEKKDDPSLDRVTGAAASARSFFADRSVGDKIAWGSQRSGVIQKIEGGYVTILDDGWPADPPLCVYTPPFVTTLRIDDMVRPKLVEETAP